MKAEVFSNGKFFIVENLPEATTAIDIAKKYGYSTFCAKDTLIVIYDDCDKATSVFNPYGVTMDGKIVTTEIINDCQ